MPILESCIVGGSIVAGSFLLHKIVPYVGAKIKNSWEENNYKMVTVTFGQNQFKAAQLLRYISDHKPASSSGKYVCVSIDNNNYMVPLAKFYIEHDGCKYKIYLRVIIDAVGNVNGICVSTPIKKNLLSINHDRINSFDEFIDAFKVKTSIN